MKTYAECKLNLSQITEQAQQALNRGEKPAAVLVHYTTVADDYFADVPHAESYMNLIKRRLHLMCIDTHELVEGKAK